MFCDELLNAAKAELHAKLAATPRFLVTDEEYAEELDLINTAEREWTRLHGGDA